MTSDGSYPPGYEPADGGAPYGRYPGDEQDGRSHSSGTARVAPGAWGPPPDAQYAPPDAQYAQGGGDWPAQPGYPSAGPDQAAGRSTGYPTQPAYGIERPATANYASMGSDRSGQPGGWQPEPPAQGGRQQSDAGYSGSFGSASVPRPPEPARAPEQNRPGGAPNGRASVGGAPMGSAPVSPGGFGGPSASNGPGGPGGPTSRGSSSGVYGTPTQQGGPGQYGGGNQPGQYGPPGQYGGGQYGGGQNGGQATTQFGGATQAGTPGQFGGGQYGGASGQYGNQGGQYGNPGGQYGSDPAMARFGQAGQDEEEAGGEGTRRSRRGLIIGLAVAGVVIIALAAVALVVSMSGDKASNYAVGSCVKQSGDKAASASCSDASAYSIVSKTDSPTKCADQTQPYVVLQRSGSADEVLCLKPAH